MKLLTLLFFSLSAILGCTENPNNTSVSLAAATNHSVRHSGDSLAAPVAIAISTPHYHFPYQLTEPDQSFKMPDKLEEISGLAIDPEDKFLYAVQDEKGNIYKVDLSSGEVTKKIDFGKDGDYEGLTYHQNTIYITKSNGTIYKVEDPDGQDPDVTTYKTDLKGKNDVEGLCYQAESNSLLIACKGIPTMGETTEEAANRKFVYRFDLKTNKIVPEPLYKISLEKVQQFLKEAKHHSEFQNFQSYLNQDKFKFNPSGIAIHPQSKEVYVLSSSKKMLLIMNTAGEIQYLAKLNKKVHRQPEGITFGKDGTLYIANEGKGGHGRIYVYKTKR